MHSVTSLHLCLISNFYAAARLRAALVVVVFLFEGGLLLPSTMPSSSTLLALFRRPSAIRAGVGFALSPWHGHMHGHGAAIASPRNRLHLGACSLHSRAGRPQCFDMHEPRVHRVLRCWTRRRRRVGPWARSEFMHGQTASRVALECFRHAFGKISRRSKQNSSFQGLETGWLGLQFLRKPRWLAQRVRFLTLSSFL